jgi:4-alpha-glucanotransferase
MTGSEVDPPAVARLSTHDVPIVDDHWECDRV